MSFKAWCNIWHWRLHTWAHRPSGGGYSADRATQPIIIIVKYCCWSRLNNSRWKKISLGQHSLFLLRKIFYWCIGLSDSRNWGLVTSYIFVQQRFLNSCYLTFFKLCLYNLNLVWEEVHSIRVNSIFLYIVQQLFEVGTIYYQCELI